MVAGSYAIAGNLLRHDCTGAYANANQDLLEILSGVDFVPPKARIDSVLGANAPADLIAIARNPVEDEGLRIRAYRALSLYSEQQTIDALVEAIPDHGEDAEGELNTTGIETVYLRAAMRSLAVVAGQQGVVHITPMLDHTSRDVRAATAHALAICGSLDAVPLLRQRLLAEEVPQVRVALEEAIRLLTGEFTIPT
jgi:HEAT repeat protein